MDAFARACACFRAGQFQLAERLLQETAANAADHAPTLHLRSILAYQRGQAAAALSFFERAVALDAVSAEYQTCLGAAYQALGQHDRAATCHRRALALRPGNAQALNKAPCR
jgi:Flp pilus assembly protein TadD